MPRPLSSYDPTMVDKWMDSPYCSLPEYELTEEEQALVDAVDEDYGEDLEDLFDRYFR